MKMNRILTLAICLGLLTGTSMGMLTIVKGEGAGSANVVNADPTLTHEILDTSWAPVTALSPYLTTFYFNVSVNDADEWTDIWNTTFTMKYSIGSTESDNPATTYRFCYNETLAQEFLVYPTTDDGYLVSFTRTVMSTTQVNYTFELRLNQTAKDTNGAAGWKYYGATTDASNVSVLSTDKFYSMNPYLNIDYWGNAGGYDFYFEAEPESSSTVSFNMLATSNDLYELNASYYGDFQAPWGTPTFWIKYDAQPLMQISNLTATPAADTIWHTTAGPYHYNQNLTHYIILDFPAGIDKLAGDYTGVTIWIEATND